LHNANEFDFFKRKFSIFQIKWHMLKKYISKTNICKEMFFEWRMVVFWWCHLFYYEWEMHEVITCGPEQCDNEGGSPKTHKTDSHTFCRRTTL